MADQIDECLDWTPPPDGGGPSGGGPPEEPLGPSSSRLAPASQGLAMRRAALCSAYAHTYHSELVPVAPRHLSIMPMDEALKVLEEDEPRIRYLAASWMHEMPHVRPHVARLVGAEEYRSLEDEVSSHMKKGPGLRLSHARVKEGRKEGRAIKPDHAGPCHHCVVYQALMRPRHEITNHRIDIHFDTVSLVTTVRVCLETDGDMTDEDEQKRFARLANPRNWKEAGPFFFRASDPVLSPVRGKLVRQANLPAIEDPWPTPPEVDGHLFEHVSLSWNPFFPVDAQNVLRGSVKHDSIGRAKSYRMSVKLDRCLSTELGFSKADGGIDVDEGAYSARPTRKLPRKTGTSICVLKRIRFTEREICGLRMGYFLNFLARIWLGPFMTVLAYEGAG